MMANEENSKKIKMTKIIVKEPTQERSKNTVNTILDACSRLLISEGFYAITKDKIAKEAGVSIGSLYQFFGNKESIVQALVKKVMSDDRQVFFDEMRMISPLPPTQRIYKMIALAIKTLGRNAELRSHLYTVKYYVSEPEVIREFNNSFQEFMRYNLPELPGRDMQKVSYILVNGLSGMLTMMLVNNPTVLNDENTVREILRLFLGYLDVPLSVMDI